MSDVNQFIFLSGAERWEAQTADSFPEGSKSRTTSSPGQIAIILHPYTELMITLSSVEIHVPG